MDGKEKIIEALKNIDVKELAEPKPVFSPEEYAFFQRSGLSADEVRTLENAEMLTQILELLPEDQKGLDRLAGALQAISKETTKENMANLLLIAQKDPQTLIQLLALTEVFDNSQPEDNK